MNPVNYSVHLRDRDGITFKIKAMKKYIPVDEITEIEGKKYRCIKGDRCNLCDLEYTTEIHCNKLKCCAWEREDGNDVNFELINNNRIATIFLIIIAIFCALLFFTSCSVLDPIEKSIPVIVKSKNHIRNDYYSFKCQELRSSKYININGFNHDACVGDTVSARTLDNGFLIITKY
jgi:hypothetical protein